MSNFSTITNSKDYVNYVFNIGTRGVLETTTEIVGMSHTIQNLLGNLAFKTSEYLTSTETLAMGFGIAASAAFAHATQSAIEFQQATASVEAISGKNLIGSEIGAKAMALSNEFGLAIGEMTQGLEALARAGIVANSSIDALMRAGVQMSKFEGTDLEESINSILSTTNLLNPDANPDSEEYAQIVADLNQRIISTSESAPLNAKNIMDTLQHVGGYASATGIDQADLFATIAQLGAKGTKGDIAGTSLRAFISAGQKDTGQRALARIGLDVSDLWNDDGTAMLPISEVKRILDEALVSAGFSAQERLEFYSDFAGYKQANQIMKIDSTEVDEYRAKIDNAMSLTDKMNIILGTVQGNWAQIWNTVSNYMTKVGSTLLPIINAILIPIKYIVKAIDAIPFSNVIGAFALGSIAVKGISTAFNALVPTISSFVLKFTDMDTKGFTLKGYFEDIAKSLSQSKDILKHINDKEYMKNIMERRDTASTDKELTRRLEREAIDQYYRERYGHLLDENGEVVTNFAGEALWKWDTLSASERAYIANAHAPDDNIIQDLIKTRKMHYEFTYRDYMEKARQQGHFDEPIHGWSSQTPLFEKRSQSFEDIVASAIKEIKENIKKLIQELGGDNGPDVNFNESNRERNRRKSDNREVIYNESNRERNRKRYQISQTGMAVGKNRTRHDIFSAKELKEILRTNIDVLSEDEVYNYIGQISGSANMTVIKNGVRYSTTGKKGRVQSQRLPYNMKDALSKDASLGAMLDWKENQQEYMKELSAYVAGLQQELQALSSAEMSMDEFVNRYQKISAELNEHIKKLTELNAQGQDLLDKNVGRGSSSSSSGRGASRTTNSIITNARQQYDEYVKTLNVIPKGAIEPMGFSSNAFMHTILTPENLPQYIENWIEHIPIGDTVTIVSNIQEDMERRGYKLFFDENGYEIKKDGRVLDMSELPPDLYKIFEKSIGHGGESIFDEYIKDLYGRTSALGWSSNGKVEGSNSSSIVFGNFNTRAGSFHYIGDNKFDTLARIMNTFYHELGHAVLHHSSRIGTVYSTRELAKQGKMDPIGFWGSSHFLVGGSHDFDPWTNSNIPDEYGYHQYGKEAEANAMGVAITRLFLGDAKEDALQRLREFPLAMEKKFNGLAQVDLSLIEAFKDYYKTNPLKMLNLLKPTMENLSPEHLLEYDSIANMSDSQFAHFKSVTMGAKDEFFKLYENVEEGLAVQKMLEEQPFFITDRLSDILSSNSLQLDKIYQSIDNAVDRRLPNSLPYKDKLPALASRDIAIELDKLEKYIANFDDVQSKEIYKKLISSNITDKQEMFVGGVMAMLTQPALGEDYSALINDIDKYIEEEKIKAVEEMFNEVPQSTLDTDLRLDYKVKGLDVSTFEGKYTYLAQVYGDELLKRKYKIHQKAKDMLIAKMNAIGRPMEDIKKDLENAMEELKYAEQNAELLDLDEDYIQGLRDKVQNLEDIKNARGSYKGIKMKRIPVYDERDYPTGDHQYKYTLGGFSITDQQWQSAREKMLAYSADEVLNSEMRPFIREFTDLKNPAEWFAYYYTADDNVKMAMEEMFAYAFNDADIFKMGITNFQYKFLQTPDYDLLFKHFTDIKTEDFADKKTPNYHLLTRWLYDENGKLREQRADDIVDFITYFKDNPLMRTIDNQAWETDTKQAFFNYMTGLDEEVEFNGRKMSLFGDDVLFNKKKKGKHNIKLGNSGYGFYHNMRNYVMDRFGLDASDINNPEVKAVDAKLAQIALPFFGNKYDDYNRIQYHPIEQAIKNIGLNLNAINEATGSNFNVHDILSGGIKDSGDLKIKKRLFNNNKQNQQDMLNLQQYARAEEAERQRRATNLANVQADMMSMANNANESAWIDSVKDKGRDKWIDAEANRIFGEAFKAGRPISMEQARAKASKKFDKKIKYGVDDRTGDGNTEAHRLNVANAFDGVDTQMVNPLYIADAMKELYGTYDIDNDTLGAWRQSAENVSNFMKSFALTSPTKFFDLTTEAGANGGTLGMDEEGNFNQYIEDTLAQAENIRDWTTLWTIAPELRERELDKLDGVFTTWKREKLIDVFGSAERIQRMSDEEIGKYWQNNWVDDIYEWKVRTSEKISDRVSESLEQFNETYNMEEGSEQFKYYMNSIGQTLTNATMRVGTLKEGMMELSNVFPMLTPLVWGLNTAQTALATMTSILAMATIFLTEAESDELKAKLKGKLGEMLAPLKTAISGTLGKAMSSIVGFVSSLSLTTVAIIGGVVASILAVVFALKKSAESHDAYVKELTEKQSLLNKESQGAYISYEQNKRLIRRGARDSEQQSYREAMYNLSKTKLESANLKRLNNAFKLAEQNGDALWGEYGARTKLQAESWWEAFATGGPIGLIAKYFAGDFESKYEEHLGYTGGIRKIREETLKRDYFHTTDAMRQASAYYDANQVAFNTLEQYKTELSELYDIESKYVKRTGDVESARQNQRFQKALLETSEKTGLTQEQILSYLNWLQIEKNVDTATQAMQATADQIVANAEKQAFAIEFGQDMDDVLGLNGVEAQQKAMIQAQADMIKMEAEDKLWWKAFWAELSAVFWAVMSPLTTLVNFLQYIYLGVNYIAQILAHGWWSDEAKQAGSALDRKGKDLQSSMGDLFGVGRAGRKARVYRGAFDEMVNTDLYSVGENAVSPYDRNNFGTDASSTGTMSSSGVSSRYRSSMGNATQMTSKRNTDEVFANRLREEQRAGIFDIFDLLKHWKENPQGSGGNLLGDLFGFILGLTPAGPAFDIANSLGSIFSSEEDRQKAKDALKATKEAVDKAQAGEKGAVIIKNININTDDDPEKIKTALMNMIIELQEQIQPRTVSRTVGEQSNSNNADNSDNTPDQSGNTNPTN